MSEEVTGNIMDVRYEANVYDQEELEGMGTNRTQRGEENGAEGGYGHCTSQILFGGKFGRSKRPKTDQRCSFVALGTHSTFWKVCNRTRMNRVRATARCMMLI